MNMDEMLNRARQLREELVGHVYTETIGEGGQIAKTTMKSIYESMKVDWQHFEIPHEWHLKDVDSVLLQVHAKGKNIWQVWVYAGFDGIIDYECHGTLEYAMAEGIKYANRLKGKK